MNEQNMRRVYEVDHLVCLRRGGLMRLVAFVATRSIMRRLLARGITPGFIRLSVGLEGPDIRIEHLDRGLDERA